MKTFQHLIITFIIISPSLIIIPISFSVWIISFCIPAIFGGVLIDVVDHYRFNLTLKKNLTWMYEIGFTKKTSRIGRKNFPLNLFHKWRNFGYVTAFCLILIISLYLSNFIEYLPVLICTSTFILSWWVHLLCDEQVLK